MEIVICKCAIKKILLREVDHHDWILIFVKNGRLNFEFGGISLTAEASSLIFLNNRSSKNSFYLLKEFKSAEYQIIALDFRDDSASEDNVYVEMKDKILSTDVLYKTAKVDDKISISNIFDGNPVNIYEWFYIVFENMINNSDGIFSLRPCDELMLALNFICRNISKKHTLNDVADVVNFSVRKLQDLIKKGLGIPYRVYKQNLKLKIANDLLRMGNKSAYVAKRLGFSSTSTFCNSFKRQTNVSPQKLHKGQSNDDQAGKDQANDYLSNKEQTNKCQPDGSQFNKD